MRRKCLFYYAFYAICVVFVVVVAAAAHSMRLVDSAWPLLMARTRCNSL